MEDGSTEVSLLGVSGVDERTVELTAGNVRATYVLWSGWFLGSPLVDLIVGVQFRMGMQV